MNTKERIDLREYEDHFPVSGSVSLNHCKEGRSNRAFYLRRKEDGVVVGYCHHCGGSGVYFGANGASRYQANRAKGEEPTAEGDSEGSDGASFESWKLPNLSEWNDGGVDQGEFGAIPKEFRRWWFLGGLNVSDYVRLRCAYISGMLVVPLTRGEEVTNIAARTKSGNDLPKWVTLGAKTHGFMTTKTSLPNFLVICEDIVSAIRLSRFCTALPLLGTSLSDLHLSDIAKWANEHREKHQVLVWLDNDSPLVVQKAKKICTKLQNHAKTGIVLKQVEAKHFIHDKELRDFTWKQI